MSSARTFWNQVVKTSHRKEWQLQQWTEAMRWYGDWLRIRAGRSSGEDAQNATTHSL
jgi:hypothetical protein